MPGSSKLSAHVKQEFDRFLAAICHSSSRMAAATYQVPLPTGRTYSESPFLVADVRKLRVVQLGSYPTANRRARTNLLTIHQRLLAQGHESTVIDLTPYNHVMLPRVHYPLSTMELVRLMVDLPADVVHFHSDSALTLRKLALALLVDRLPKAKKVWTLHLGGKFNGKKALRAWRWGVTAAILRRFDRLIAVSPEVATFYECAGVKKNRVHRITSFPRLRWAQTAKLSDEMESFCRQHSPLLLESRRLRARFGTVEAI